MPDYTRPAPTPAQVQIAKAVGALESAQHHAAIALAAITAANEDPSDAGLIVSRIVRELRWLRGEDDPTAVEPRPELPSVRRDLRCPYCGSPLDIETLPSGHYDDMPSVIITCTHAACRATWDTEGTARTDGDGNRPVA